ECLSGNWRMKRGPVRRAAALVLGVYCVRVQGTRRRSRWCAWSSPESNFQDRVTAIDISADLVERGKGLAEQEGFAGRIEWLVGDALELSLPDGFFDLVLAHTLVSHLPEPKRIVQQAARVVRPGGTVVILTATTRRFWRQSHHGLVWTIQHRRRGDRVSGCVLVLRSGRIAASGLSWVYGRLPPNR